MKQRGNFGNGIRGLRIVGPGLYVWDSDAREALQLAADLGVRPSHTPRSARRRAPSGRAGVPRVIR
jgi:hypothetical protein